MRDPVRENREAAEAVQKAREVERERMAELAAGVLNSAEGAELFGYLSRKFHLRGRSFLSGDARAPTCPFAAASRDGEKAVLWHLVELARIADPKFSIP